MRSVNASGAMRKGINLTGEIVLRRLDEKSGLTWAELTEEFGLMDERSSRLKELLDCFDTLLNLDLIYIPKLPAEYMQDKMKLNPRFSLGLELHDSAELKDLRIYTSRKWSEIQNALSGSVIDRASLITIEPLFGKPNSDQNRNDIFVVMPFKEDMHTIYKDHITGVAEEMKLSILRADDLYGPNMIMNDIWNLIFGSSMVIADLTGQRANVFYELGIAHTIGKPVIMIARSAEDIPFDLRHMRTIIYEYTVPGMKAFEKHLKSAIRETLNK
jgi:hypothetical protein